jgi:hypothetical protein
VCLKLPVTPTPTTKPSKTVLPLTLFLQKRKTTTTIIIITPKVEAQLSNLIPKTKKEHF